MKASILVLNLVSFLALAAPLSAQAKSMQDSLEALRDCFSSSNVVSDDGATELAFERWGFDPTRSMLKGNGPDSTLVVYANHPITGHPGLISYSFKGNAKFYPLPDSFKPGVVGQRIVFNLCAFGEKCTRANSVTVTFQNRRHHAYTVRRYGLFETIPRDLPPGADAFNSGERLYGWDIWETADSKRKSRMIAPLVNDLVSRLSAQMMAISEKYDRIIRSRSLSEVEKRNYERDKKNDAERMFRSLQECKQNARDIPGLEDGVMKVQTALKLSYNLSDAELAKPTQSAPLKKGGAH